MHRFDTLIRFIALSGLVASLGSVFCNAPSARAEDRPVLNDWFALGSGCRAKSDLPGNVEMSKSDRHSAAGATYTAKFLLKDFLLSDGKLIETPKRFGKECAVRLNINPPQGKKIIALRAHTKLLVTKKQGPALDLLAELKLGPASLGRSNLRLEESSEARLREYKISMAAGEGTSVALPQLGCAEPKIIGFDYSWILTKDIANRESAQVGLGRDRVLTIEAELGDCEP